ncbi:recombination protein NinB [Symbiopectobacterium purcellii]|uniref:Recombination protein NinB n=1 Tax=Symbiopectobacterium purcellii TaxID=2871826 RepID=A0ABX9ARJ9_9ENTR|nr:recombination protein NinB [Symbiopectobacterium purcellii]QZN97807.1 recombination protein NinB [Symbiopectobacterium purcellii]
MKQVYHLIEQARKQNAISFIQQLPTDSDKPLVVTVEERKRTLEQNSRLWATLRDISEQVVWYGRKMESESWKHIFTAALKRQETVPGIDGGFVVLGQSTSKMRVSEMRDLIELMNAFGAEHGVRWSEESRLAIEWATRFGDKK